MPKQTEAGGRETLEEAERRVGLQDKRDGRVQEVGLGDLRAPRTGGAVYV